MIQTGLEGSDSDGTHKRTMCIEDWEVVLDLLPGP